MRPSHETARTRREGRIRLISRRPISLPFAITYNEFFDYTVEFWKAGENARDQQLDYVEARARPVPRNLVPISRSLIRDNIYHIDQDSRLWGRRLWVMFDEWNGQTYSGGTYIECHDANEALIWKLRHGVIWEPPKGTLP